MGTLSASLALCKRKPPVTGGFRSQSTNNAELWYCFVLAWISCWTNELLVIWGAWCDGTVRRYARGSLYCVWSWWRHQMETFFALLALCEGNSPVTGEFPSQRPVTRSFGVFFDLRLNKRLSKQWRGWWFETPSRSLWRHCNGVVWLLSVLPTSFRITSLALEKFELPPCPVPMNNPVEYR